MNRCLIDVSIVSTYTTKSERIVRLTLVFNYAGDLLGKFFERRHEHRVELLRKVYVKVLLASWQVNNLSLKLEERLHEGDVEVLREKIHIVVFFRFELFVLSITQSFNLSKTVCAHFELTSSIV